MTPMVAGVAPASRTICSSDNAVVTPSGFDERNVSTPESLVALGEYAMKNPVFAQIVGTPSVDLPGAGTVVNTNGMLADPAWSASRPERSSDGTC